MFCCACCIKLAAFDASRRASSCETEPAELGPANASSSSSSPSSNLGAKSHACMRRARPCVYSISSRRRLVHGLSHHNDEQYCDHANTNSIDAHSGCLPSSRALSMRSSELISAQVRLLSGFHQRLLHFVDRYASQVIAKLLERHIRLMRHVNLRQPHKAKHSCRLSDRLTVRQVRSCANRRRFLSTKSCADITFLEHEHSC